VSDDRPGEPDARPRPVIRDRRKIDPDTFELRRPLDAAGGAAPEEGPVQDNNEFVPDGEAGGDGPEVPLDAAASDATSEPDAAASDSIVGAKIAELEELATERTADLQRLQAEYANYKRRVDRDRNLARAAGVEAVVLDLLPVLDSVEAAREHGELTGGFRLVADELERVGAKYGLVTFGEVGEPFDPNVHEALMHMPYDGEYDVVVVSGVMQKGVRLNDRVIRPARVGVADPE